MGDGAGSLVYPAGSGGTIISVLSGGILNTIISSGSIIISGTAQVVGSSGLAIPQIVSGWAHSGALVGDLGTAPAISESVTPVRQSGMESKLSVDGSGNLRVTLYSGNIVRLGSTAGFNVLADVTSPIADNIAANGRAGLNVLSYPFIYDTANASYNRLQTNRSGTGAAQVGSSGKDYVWVAETAGRVIAVGSGSTFAVADFALTFLSGGAQLSSGVCSQVRIQNRGEGQVVSGNIVYVGGSGGGTNPYSGYGFPLLSGDILPMAIDNLNKINVWAASSGLILRWIAT